MVEAAAAVITTSAVSAAVIVYICCPCWCYSTSIPIAQLLSKVKPSLTLRCLHLQQGSSDFVPPTQAEVVAFDKETTARVISQILSSPIPKVHIHYGV